MSTPDEARTDAPEPETVEEARTAPDLDVADTPEARLIAALAEAQAAFPPIPKTLTAVVKSQKGDYSYRYADLSDVLAAVRPVLAERGLAVTQRTVREQGVGYMLITELRHVGGAMLTSEVEVGQSPGNPQGFGGALTYLRRYELVTLLGIAAEEDRDAQDVERTDRNAPREAPLPAWASDATVDRRRELVALLGPTYGEEVVKTTARSAANTWGSFPDAVIAFAKALVANHEAARKAQAAAVEAAQAAAEAPDEPSPEPESQALDEAAERMAPEGPNGAGPGDPPAVDEDDGPEPEDLAEQDVERLPSGSVAIAGELPLDPAQATGVLRAHGCTCTDPLNPPHDDACPIVGHGIPF